MTDKIESRIITNLEEFQSLGPAWHQLLTRCPRATVFQTHEWYSAWLQTFQEYGIFIVAIFSNGQLSATAPLIRSSSRRFGMMEQRLEFIGAPNFASDFSDLLVAEDDQELYKRLFQSIASDLSWNVLKLFNVPGASPTLRYAESFFGAKARCIAREISDCPRWVFGDAEKDSDLLKKKSLKRRINYFNREGKLIFHDLRTAEKVEPYFKEFFDQHIARRAMTESPSLFLNPREQEFYRALAQRLPADVLRFGVLEWNQKPVAFHFGFKFGETFTWYKPSFDPALAKHSPGEALLWHLFKQAMDEKCNVFDFTVGGEEFKYRFSNETPKNQELRVFRSRYLHSFEKAKLAAATLKTRLKRQSGS